jgi:hypothetical protein
MRRAARKEATSIGTGTLRTGWKFYERTCPALSHTHTYILESVLMISSHCENGFENGVGIQELPNTGSNPGSSLLKFEKMKEPVVLVFEEKKESEKPLDPVIFKKPEEHV